MARRADLIRIATKVIHEEGPDVTMEAIAHASGTSKSVMYRYFTDKDELKAAIGASILSRLDRKLSEAVAHTDDFETTVANAVRIYVEEASRSLNVYRFVIRPSVGLSEFLIDTATLLARNLPASVDPLSREAWGRGAVGFVQDSYQWWVEDGQSMSTTDLTSHITRSLVSGAPQ